MPQDYASQSQKATHFQLSFMTEYQKQKAAGTLPANALDQNDPDSLISTMMRPYLPTLAQHIAANGGLGAPDDPGPMMTPGQRIRQSFKDMSQIAVGDVPVEPVPVISPAVDQAVWYWSTLPPAITGAVNDLSLAGGIAKDIAGFYGGAIADAARGAAHMVEGAIHSTSDADGERVFLRDASGNMYDAKGNLLKPRPQQ